MQSCRRKQSQISFTLMKQYKPVHALHLSGWNWLKVEAEIEKLNEGPPSYTEEVEDTIMQVNNQTSYLITARTDENGKGEKGKWSSDIDLTYSSSAETELRYFLEPSSLGSKSLDGFDAVENDCNSSLGDARLPKELTWLIKPFSLISVSLVLSESTDPESGLTREIYISAICCQDSYNYKREKLLRRNPKYTTD